MSMNTATVSASRKTVKFPKNDVSKSINKTKSNSTYRATYGILKHEELVTEWRKNVNDFNASSMTVKEFAESIGCCYATAYNWIHYFGNERKRLSNAINDLLKELSIYTDHKNGYVIIESKKDNKVLKLPESISGRELLDAICYMRD